MSGQYMTQYVATEAQRLINTGRVKEMTYGEAKAFLSNDLSAKNDWRGFPEAEMVNEYNTNCFLVARFVVWRHETTADAIALLPR